PLEGAVAVAVDQVLVNGPADLAVERPARADVGEAGVGPGSGWRAGHAEEVGDVGLPADVRRAAEGAVGVALDDAFLHGPGDLGPVRVAGAHVAEPGVREGAGGRARQPVEPRHRGLP